MIEAGTNRLKAIDFSSLTSIDSSNYYAPGTNGYMAPERVKVQGSYSLEKSDVFSLGVSLFVILYLQYPFGTDS